MTQKGRDSDFSSKSERGTEREREREGQIKKWTCVVQTRLYHCGRDTLNFWRRLMSRHVSVQWRRHGCLHLWGLPRPATITLIWHSVLVLERVTHSSFEPLNMFTFMLMPSGVSSCSQAFRWQAPVKLKSATIQAVCASFRNYRFILSVASFWV